jgi:hypothetical protein
MVDGSTEANEPPSEDLEMADELASMDYGEEEPTGGALLRAPAQPEFSMGTELLDYDRLEMMGAEQPGSRGRLSPANPWASVFAVGVSVQVDVVMLLIDAVERRRPRWDSSRCRRGACRWRAWISSTSATTAPPGWTCPRRGAGRRCR